MKKKIRITDHPNSYEMTVTYEDGTERSFLYMNAIDLAFGIIERVDDEIKDELELDTMRKAIYDHAAHQEIFRKELHANNAKVQIYKRKAEKYLQQRKEAREEINKLTKKLKKYETI